MWCEPGDAAAVELQTHDRPTGEELQTGIFAESSLAGLSAIDEGAVTAVEITHPPVIPIMKDLAVAATHAVTGQADVTVAGTADDEAVTKSAGYRIAAGTRIQGPDRCQAAVPLSAERNCRFVVLSASHAVWQARHSARPANLGNER
jgi:hypothetical protein